MDDEGDVNDNLGNGHGRPDRGHGRHHHHKEHEPMENKYDLDGSGCVDEADLVIFRAAFGSAKGQPRYNEACDFNGDGLVNAADFNEFRQHIGEGCDDLTDEGSA